MKTKFDISICSRHSNKAYHMNSIARFKRLLIVLCCISISSFFFSCNKEESEILDPYEKELKAKLIGTWIDEKGREQYTFESSGIVTWTLLSSDISVTFKYRIQKQTGYQREYYELLMEDNGEGSGGHYELEFVSSNVIKLGTKTYHRGGTRVEYNFNDVEDNGNSCGSNNANFHVGFYP